MTISNNQVLEIDFVQHCNDSSCSLGGAWYTCVNCNKQTVDYGDLWYGDLWFDYEENCGKEIITECEHCNNKLILKYDINLWSYIITNLVIDKFRGEYNFLSNFYPAKVFYKNREYKTSEHAYQSMKAISITDHDYIALSITPALSKERGGSIIKKSNWNEIRVDIMYEIVLCKFEQNLDLMKKLLATDNITLIEGNTWNDTFWGVCNDKGENNLGKILMKVREKYKHLI